MTRHLVQFSTGAASAEVALRAVAAHGKDQVTLLTADTKAEDDDNWRYARQVHDYLGQPEWVILADGRTPLEVGRDERCVPNDRMAVCSKILKRELLWRWMRQNADPADAVIYLGYDWTEGDRKTAAEKHWKPWTVACPLMDPPYLWKDDILQAWRDRGIEPPSLYAQGFQHANCGGACVRGGQAQWQLLLRVNRPRYLEWEQGEEQTRQMLGKDVSILRDRTAAARAATGKTSVPLTLRTFRQRLENQPAMFDADDWGACGCQMLDDDTAADERAMP